ncbi:MAG: hypothetical protein ACQETQ_05190 [Spirochaetota bacterium]
MAYAQRSKPVTISLATIAALLGALTLIVVPAERARALEVDASVGAGNIGFFFDRQSEDSDLGGGTFLPDGHLTLSETVLDGFIISGTFEHDRILSNTFALTFGYEGQTIEVAAGPFLGFFVDFDNPEVVKPGVTTKLRTELWEAGFVSLRSDITLDPELSTKTDDFRQFRLDARAGFYLPNIITSFEYERASLFTTDGDRRSEDRRREYAVQTEVFRKNIPYRILLRFALRNELREFRDGAKHAFGAGIFTPGITYRVDSQVRLNASLENGVYVFGREDLLGEVEPDRYFFRAQLGCTVSL